MEQEKIKIPEYVIEVSGLDRKKLPYLPNGKAPFINVMDRLGHSNCYINQK